MAGNNNKKNKSARRAATGSGHSVMERFNAYFGQGELANWKKMMVDLGFEEEFTSKTQCQKALSKVWINIPDFLEAVETGGKVVRFPNQETLSEYTRSNRKTFPMKDIPKNSPIMWLLKPLSGKSRNPATVVYTEEERQADIAFSHEQRPRNFY